MDNDTRAAPLVSAEINLRGLPWMRLDTGRLLDSDLFALSSGDEFKAALALWCKAWSQSPAGSLPTDDKILSHLSGAGPRWLKVKAMALRGWVECNDGRLYHPVVAEQVNVAWTERQEYRAEIEGQNQRKQKERVERSALFDEIRAAGIDIPWNTSTKRLREIKAELGQPVTVTGRDWSHDRHSDGHGVDGTGRDGTLNALTPDTSTRADTSSRVAGEMARALRMRGFPECAEAYPDLTALAADGYTVAEVIEAADAGQAQGGKPIGWIASRTRGRRADAARRTTDAHAHGVTPIRQAQPSAEDLAERSAIEECERACRMEINNFRLSLISREEAQSRVDALIRARDEALTALGRPLPERAA